jgi:tripartite-type tricarboxylate transporter receptor subunit TctC
VGPKDLPKDIVKILHDAFKKSLDDPNFLSVMDNYQMPIMYQNTGDFTKYWADSYIEAGEQVKRYMPK